MKIRLCPVRSLSVLLLAFMAASDMLVVAAAGNDGVNVDVSPTYPAAYSAANIISVAAATPSLTPVSTSVVPGGTITFTLADGPGNVADWVGLYCPETDADGAHFDWKYLSNSKALPATGLTAATITFAAPAAATTCNARLFASGGMSKLATSTTVTVTAVAAPTVTPASQTVTASSTITVVVAGGPGNVADWVGLYCPTTAADGAQLDWKYLSNSKALPATGLTAATITFAAPAAASTCNARLFASGGMSKLATSTTVTVTAMAAPTVTPASQTVAPSTTITLAVAGGPGNVADWVGLYCPETDADGAHFDWKYLSNSKALPATGLTTATITFAAPAAATTCNARLFASGGMSKLATSTTVTVAATTTVTPTSQTVDALSTITVAVAGGPGNVADWVGLYCPETGADGAHLDWKYLSNSKALPATGLTAATITFAAPAAATTCNARLFASGGMSRLATSATVTVTVTVTPTVTPASQTVAPSSTITLAVADGPGNVADWVGLYCPETAADGAQLDWKYLSNSKALPATGQTAATITFAAPAAATTCNARLFASGGMSKLATSVTVTVATLDGTPPTVSLTAPAAGATVSATVSVTATASDNVGVVGVQFKLDGVNLGNEDATSPYSVAWNTTTVANGSHALTAVARDAAGNVSSSAVTVTVDNNAQAELVAAYSYNDGAGTTAADTSVNNNTATVVAATWSTACKFGKCLSFNGTSSFAESADVAALTLGTAATFEAWVRLSATPTETASIFNKWNQTADDEYLVGITSARALVFAWQTTGGGSWPSVSFNEAASTGTIPLNTLTHIAVVRSGATLTFYINGTPEPSLTVLDTNPFRNGVNTLRVGGQGRGGWEDRFFAGVIDEARIYSRALTQAEIQADMNTPIGPDTTPPVLSAISASAIASSSATISWTTNESSDTEIEYGLTTAYGSATPLNSSLLTDHWVTVGALLPSTLHHYRVRSRDVAGNLAVSGDHTFTTTTAVDLTPPTVSLTAPAANSTVSGIVTVSAIAADNVGVVGVQFKLDGEDLGFMDTAAPYAITWDTTATSSGAHTLTAVVWDAAGNSTSSTAVTVTVSSAVVMLAWDGITEANLAGYRVYVGDASGVYTMSFDVGNTTMYTVTGLEAGRLYYFAVTAYDQSMNESGFSNEVSTTP